VIAKQLKLRIGKRLKRELTAKTNEKINKYAQGKSEPMLEPDQNKRE